MSKKNTADLEQLRTVQLWRVHVQTLVRHFGRKCRRNLNIHSLISITTLQ